MQIAARYSKGIDFELIERKVISNVWFAIILKLEKRKRGEEDLQWIHRRRLIALNWPENRRKGPPSPVRYTETRF